MDRLHPYGAPWVERRFRDSNPKHRLSGQEIIARTPRGVRLLVLLWAPACNPSTPLDESWRCDPRLLEPGEVRARQVPCTDELIEGGEGQRGDWLLENEWVRFVIRDAPMALTRLDTAGGSIIDMSLPGESDAMVELVPSFSGEVLVSAHIALLEGSDPGLSIEGTTASGAEVEIEFRLAAGSRALQVQGPDSWSGVLPPESRILDGSLELPTQNDSLLLIPDGPILPAEAWVELEAPTQLVLGERTDALQSAYPEATWVEGLSDGEWIELRADTQTLARLEVTDGLFTGPIPDSVDGLVATASGHADGDAYDPSQNEMVTVGDAGRIRVELISESGEPLPGTLVRGTEAYSIPPGGGWIATGPGTESTWVHAGPAYEAQAWPDLEVQDDIEIRAVLRPAVEEAWLLRLGEPAWPDSRENRSPEQMAGALAGAGIQLSVLVANDEVALSEVPSHLQPYLVSAGGSRAASEQGQPFAWPWSATVKRPAHGAIPWQQLEPMDLIAAQEKNGSRYTVVDPDWVASAPPTWAWDPPPFALQIQSLDDLPTVIELADQSTPIRVLGPLTWVDKPSASAELSESEIMAQLNHGVRTATNGPQIHLRINGVRPGEVLEPPTWEYDHGFNSPIQPQLDVELEITAPEWMPVDHVALIGPGGEILSSWEPERHHSPRLSIETRIPQRDWIAAICWSDEANPPLQNEPAWALSGIIWIGRP